MAWYIDAWAPRDGVAFGSERSPDDRDLVQTVQIAAPEFTAVPIASVSTALWATRGGFQEKFHDDQGEVAFDTLEQLVETVRRAFLGGGRGLPPRGGAGPGPAGEPPERPRGPEPSAPVEPSPSPNGWAIVCKVLMGPRSPSDRNELAVAFAHLIDESFGSHIEPFGTETVVAMLGQIVQAQAPALRVARMRNLIDWIDALACAGLWPPDGRLESRLEMASRHDPAVWNLASQLIGYPWSSPWWVKWADTRQDACNLGALLFGIPIPQPWRTKLGADTIGDALSIVAADRTVIGAATEFRDIVPLLLVAKLLAAHALGPTMNDVLHDEMLREAGRWLAHLLPGSELENHVAERYISAMVSAGPGA